MSGTLPPMRGDMLAKLRAMSAELAAAPPVPARIMASHAVPYGRAYRQWNARGDLIVWANRGEIEDMPHVRLKAYGMTVAVSDLCPPAAFGIPVVNA